MEPHFQMVIKVPLDHIYERPLNYINFSKIYIIQKKIFKKLI